MRKVALLVFLLTNLGGVAMAAPAPTAQERPPIAAPQRRSLGNHGCTLVYNNIGLFEVHVDAFARVPQLDGSTKDLPIVLANDDPTAADTINKALMRSFEQALNQESARQGRSVDALLARGTALGNRDENGAVKLYTFDLDAEMRIVREAYLLHTQPARA